MNNMQKIEIPENLIKKLGPEMKMDTHWIDIRLRDGRRYKNIIVRGGRYIVGKKKSLNRIDEIPNLKSTDILDIYRHSFFHFWWM
jgi:hypothetical protein